MDHNDLKGRKAPAPMSDGMRALYARAQRTAERLRAAGKNDRANRFCGRAEVVTTRYAARRGETVPTLYISSCGHWLQTWPGNKVARVHATGTVRFNGAKLTCYCATLEGRNYYGRSQGAGMFINLRAGALVKR